MPIFCAAIITLVTAFARDYGENGEGILENALIRSAPQRTNAVELNTCMCVCVCVLSASVESDRYGEEREIMRKWLPPFTRRKPGRSWAIVGNETSRFPLLQRGKNEFARVVWPSWLLFFTTSRLNPRLPFFSFFLSFTRVRARSNSRHSSLIRAVSKTIYAEKNLIILRSIYETVY